MGTRLYILPQKKEKNDGLESGDGEKRVLEKKKEQEGVEHHITPP